MFGIVMDFIVRTIWMGIMPIFYESIFVSVFIMMIRNFKNRDKLCLVTFSDLIDDTEKDYIVMLMWCCLSCFLCFITILLKLILGKTTAHEYFDDLIVINFIYTIVDIFILFVDFIMYLIYLHEENVQRRKDEEEIEQIRKDNEEIAKLREEKSVK